jgi:hypothetical protein
MPSSVRAQRFAFVAVVGCRLATGQQARRRASDETRRIRFGPMQSLVPTAKATTSAIDASNGRRVPLAS